MQTHRRETRIKNKKEKIRSVKSNLIISIIVGVIVTLIVFLRGYFEDIPMTGSFGFVGLYLGVFFFSFGFVFLLSIWKKIKKRKIAKNTRFLIISLIMSGLATYASEGNWLSFIIGVGCCYAFFTIFTLFDYETVKQNFVEFIKSFAYGVLFPSMFLIIALMGVIDNQNTFMSLVEPSIEKVSIAITNGFTNVVQQTYDLGKQEYSLLLIITIFMFLILFATYNFLKKTWIGEETK